MHDTLSISTYLNVDAVRRYLLFIVENAVVSSCPSLSPRNIDNSFMRLADSFERYNVPREFHMLSCLLFIVR